MTVAGMASKGRRLAVALGFLAPNILGFLAFTALPLVVSLVMAFTDWNLDQHNMFQDGTVKFVGLRNFRELFADRDFGKFFGNTLFFMMGMPFGIAGSLGAALLLNRDLKPKRRKAATVFVSCVASAAGVAILCAVGMGASAMTMLFVLLGSAVLVGGVLGGHSVYRTLFYIPSFTSGVATFILWKALYNPGTGPVNAALRPVLDALSAPLGALPVSVAQGLSYASLAACGGLACLMAARRARLAREGELGKASLAASALLLALPLVCSRLWLDGPMHAGIAWASVAGVAAFAGRGLIRRADFPCDADRDLGGVVIVDGALLVVGFALVGLSCLWPGLPATAAGEGLQPPEWLTSYYWAKPALMLIGLWGAVGSNTMLLYLAGLSAIPTELYEAGDIDGAGPFARFRHITWPQLANVTFFVVVTGVIGSLQGGFDMARAMTQGGPAGATTTIAYYIYNEGFASGRLGYASAVAWTMFAMVFVVTLFNWKFGNRYTND